MMRLSVQFHRFNGYSPDGIFSRDNTLFRKGLVELLQKEPGLAVVGEACRTAGRPSIRRGSCNRMSC